MGRKKKFILSVVFLGPIFVAFSLWRADSSSSTYWEQSGSSAIVVDHSQWQNILDDYLVIDDPIGINLFDYSGFVDDGSTELDEYIANVSRMDPAVLSKSEQMAYWINLYNALTVQVIVKNYPISSIKDIGRFGAGPWDDVATVIQGFELSLNDIEHEILRPIWDDFRVHFAVNCASIGCPNLLPEAFAAENTSELLDRGAREYLGHPRGLQFIGEKLVLSSIFDWYQTDFASNEEQLLIVLSQFLTPDQAEKVSSYRGDVGYHYDWQLNQESSPLN